MGHQPEKFVAHDLEITLPAEDANIFAVVHFQGLQHKVTKDDIIMLEKVPLEVGQIFVFDRVLLVGTKDYTSVGRPYVDTAKVMMFRLYFRFWLLLNKILQQTKKLFLKRKEGRVIKEMLAINKMLHWLEL